MTMPTRYDRRTTRDLLNEALRASENFGNAELRLQEAREAQDRVFDDVRTMLLSAGQDGVWWTSSTGLASGSEHVALHCEDGKIRVGRIVRLAKLLEMLPGHRPIVAEAADYEVPDCGDDTPTKLDPIALHFEPPSEESDPTVVESFNVLGPTTDSVITREVDEARDIIALDEVVAGEMVANAPDRQSRLMARLGGRRVRQAHPTSDSDIADDDLRLAAMVIPDLVDDGQVAS